MRKLTALFVASTLALGAANLAHAADTTTAAPAEREADDATIKASSVRMRT